jgi:TRAP-type mannitol/chloroaromatic compound transport system permease small subunit
MERVMVRFVRVVDAFNYRVGRVTMYLLFGMMAILLWSSISKTFFNPSLWTLEMAQFAMVAYFILGGPYSMQMGAHVRMDLLYFLLTYLGFLLWGGIDSTAYAFKYGWERSPTAWRPYLWPIKVVMCIGIFLMLLQAVSELFKDILRLRGREI